jgi:hypothetical protein
MLAQTFWGYCFKSLGPVWFGLQVLCFAFSVCILKKHGRGAESGKIIAITTKGENSKGERSLCFPKCRK